MDAASLHHLAIPAHLRAFIDATADMTGASTLAVLGAVAEVLERQLRRRSDDMYEVHQLGNLLQAVRAVVDSAPSGYESR